MSPSAPESYLFSHNPMIGQQSLVGLLISLTFTERLSAFLRLGEAVSQFLRVQVRRWYSEPCRATNTVLQETSLLPPSHLLYYYFFFLS